MSTGRLVICAIAGTALLGAGFVFASRANRCRLPDTLDARTTRAETMLEIFRLYHGRYPTQTEGLAVRSTWGGESLEEAPLVERRLLEVDGCTLVYRSDDGGTFYALHWAGQCPPADSPLYTERRRS